MKPALFALALACFWALAPAAPPVGVGRTVAVSAAALAARGRLDVAALGDDATLPATVVHDGQRRPTRALGAIAALLPAQWIIQATARQDRAGRWARVLVSGSAAVPAALVCVLFFGLLRRDGLSARAALVFTLLLALATPLCWYARVPDGTAWATLLLLAAVRAARALVAAADGGGAAAAGALGGTLAGLVLVEPALLLAALVLLVWCGVHRRARLDLGAAAAAVLPLLAAVAALLAWRAHVGAHPDPTGDLLEGLDGLLLSTGKSLLLYAPPVLLAPLALYRLWRSRRAEVELILVVSAAALLAAARLDDWHGDPTWGPRRAIPLVPLLLEAVALGWAARPRRAALALLGAAGLWVQILGLALPPTTWLDVTRTVRLATGAASWFTDQPTECHFIPQFSPIAGHAWLLSHLVRHDEHFDRSPPYQLLLEHPPRLEGLLPTLHLDWFARDWPPALAAGWLCALGLVAASAAWTLRRRIV